MSTAMKGVENAQLIERFFGGWPSFHDAEIHTILLTRDPNGGPQTQMDITIHHWELTNEVDSKGYFVLRHHTLSTLRFSDLTDLDLAGFNHQNALLDLEISAIPEDVSGVRFAVSMPTSFGCEASFKCREIRVLSAEPYTKP